MMVSPGNPSRASPRRVIAPSLARPSKLVNYSPFGIVAVLCRFLTPASGVYSSALAPLGNQKAMSRLISKGLP